MVRGLLLALACAVLVNPLAVAVSPSDNDGGSGGDASDLGFTGGVPIAPGHIEGSFSPTDSWDTYTFSATLGDVIDVTFFAEPGTNLQVWSPGGAIMAALGPNGHARVVAWQAGTWSVMVYPDDAVPAAQQYSFDFAIHAGWALDIKGPAAWRAFEIVPTAPAQVAINFRAPPTVSGAGGACVFEGATNEIMNGYNAIEPGASVAIDSLGFAQPLPTVQTPGAASTRSFAFSVDIRGPVRVACVTSMDDVGIQMRLSSASAPSAFAAASGMDRFSWTPQSVRAPGVVARSAQSHVATFDADTVAFFTAPSNGRAVSPTGATYRDSSPLGTPITRSPVVFDAPPAGDWTFQLDTAASVGFDGNAPVLWGAQIPRLGVANTHPIFPVFGG